MDKSARDAIRNSIFILKIVGIAFLYYIIIEILQPLNSEELIENWSIGLTFLIVFSALYIVPFDNLIFRQKRLYAFMVIFWLSWFLADFLDFIETIQEFLIASVGGV